jgi:hypothetical protein
MRTGPNRLRSHSPWLSVISLDNEEARSHQRSGCSLSWSLWASILATVVMPETDLTKEREVAQNNEQGWDVSKAPRDAAQVDSLPALDAHGFNGIQEIASLSW